MCPPNLPLQNSLMDTNIGGSVGKNVGHPVSKMSPGSLEQPVFRGRVGNIGIFDFFIFFTSPDKSSYQIQLTNGRKLFRSYHEFCAFVQQTHQVQYHTIFDNNKEWILTRSIFRVIRKNVRKLNVRIKYSRFFCFGSEKCHEIDPCLKMSENGCKNVRKF